MTHKPLLIAVAVSWLVGATMLTQSASPGLVGITVPVALVLVGIASYFDADAWGDRIETFITGTILVLVTGDLIPYWVVAYLSNAPYGVVTRIDTLAGLVAGLVAVTLGWYVTEYLLNRAHNQGNGGDVQPTIE